MREFNLDTTAAGARRERDAQVQPSRTDIFVEDGGASNDDPKALLRHSGHLTGDGEGRGSPPGEHERRTPRRPAVRKDTSGS